MPVDMMFNRSLDSFENTFDSKVSKSEAGKSPKGEASP
jgi:hypothetical protein